MNIGFIETGKFKHVVNRNIQRQSLFPEATPFSRMPLSTSRNPLAKVSLLELVSFNRKMKVA
jgi:hypothetical protein